MKMMMVIVNCCKQPNRNTQVVHMTAKASVVVEAFGEGVKGKGGLASLFLV